VGITQQPQLLLDDRDGQRRVFGDLCGHGITEGLQLIARHEVVEDAELHGTVGADRPGGEKHLAGHARPDHIDEMQDAGGIVRDTDLGRGDGECGAGAADGDIADKREVTGTSPDTPLDHGDHRGRKQLDRPQGLLQRVVVGKRVTSRHRQLRDVEPRRPDLDTRCGTDDNSAGLALFEKLQRLDQFAQQLVGKAVSRLGVIEDDGTDVVAMAGYDQ